MNSDTREKRMRALRRLSDVPRWTIVPTLRRQNVAEHSFHVACVALLVAGMHTRMHDGKHTAELLKYALMHDMDESATGDTPSPYKRYLKSVGAALRFVPAAFDMRGVIDDVRDCVKIADLLEALIFINEEKAMGNTRLQEIWSDVRSNFEKAWRLFPWHGDNKPSASNIIIQVMNIYNPCVHPGMEVLL